MSRTAPLLIAVLTALGLGRAEPAPGAAPGTVQLVPGGRGATPSIDLALAREYFAEAEAITSADGASLWPGRLYGALLFVDRGSREVVANQPDSAGQLRTQGDVWVGTWPEEMAVWNGSVEFGGRTWTMLAWPLPLGRYQRRVLLAHELFHRLQADNGWPAGNPGNTHLDSEAGRTWLRLEWRALQEALARGGEARRAAIRDALLFRAERQRLFPEGAAEERALELNEGLAEYTGVAVAIPAEARAGWVARHLDNYDAMAARSSIVRNFAYASGPGYGVLLDARSGTWRSTVLQRGDLGALLAEVYRIPMPVAAPDQARARAALYEGDRLFADEAARTVQRVAEQAKFRERFITGPTLVLPALNAFQYSFDPNGVIPFEGGGTVYLGASVRDEWGRLNVSEAGMLAVRADGRVVRVVVPAPADASARPLRGDGWELELAEGWEITPAAEGAGFTVSRRR